MARHNDTGKKGEDMAKAWFIHKGYIILETNWRHAHWEVDLIATKNNILHFIEVKTKRTARFGLPEEQVSKQKFRNLLNAAEQYLYQQPQWQRIQFNILAIRMMKGTEPEYFLLEDVYL